VKKRDAIYVAKRATQPTHTNALFSTAEVGDHVSTYPRNVQTAKEDILQPQTSAQRSGKILGDLFLYSLSLGF
jgi:hypothetical protein